MPSCYICGCSIRNGEGFRRKVLTSESARVYFTRIGGGSYGQTYSLRTLCSSCATQLDGRNKSLAWQLPISVIAGLAGTIMAVRWANTSHSQTSALGSLFYAFFLFGGLGFITYFFLKLISTSEKSENSYGNSEQEIEQDYRSDSLIGEPDDELSDFKESIMQVALEVDDIGISFHGCHALPNSAENWVAINENIIENMPPKHYPSKIEWEKYLKKTIYKKFISAVSGNDEQLKYLAFPKIDGEEDENYTVRLNNAISLSKQRI
jgi:hypothetical protein